MARKEPIIIKMNSWSNIIRVVLVWFMARAEPGFNVPPVAWLKVTLRAGLMACHIVSDKIVVIEKAKKITLRNNISAILPFSTLPMLIL
jgi:hypothetical protein